MLGCKAGVVASGSAASTLTRGLDVGGDPVTGGGDAVVDAGLILLGTRVAGRHDADQVPDAVVIQHQRSSRVSLARVPASELVTRAHHLLVDADVDAPLPVPGLADRVLDHRDRDVLQHLGPQLGSCSVIPIIRSEVVDAWACVGAA